MRVERCLDRMLLGVVVCCALAAPAGAVTTPKRICERIVKANVVAIRQPIWLNRLGAHIPDGMMYALARDVVDGSGRSCDNGIPGDPLRPPVTAACLATGAKVHLRDDKRTRPLVLRANEGDCLQIAFANLLSSSGATAAEEGTPGLLSKAPGTVDRAKDSAANLRQRLEAQAQGKLRQRLPAPPAPGLLSAKATDETTLVPPTTTAAGVHVQGLTWVNGASDDGSYVGVNASSLVAPGKWTTYTLFAEHEGSYLLYSTADDWTNPNPATSGGADGGTLAAGLFGSVNVQPTGSAVKPFGKKWEAEWYRSQANEQDLCLASKDGVYNPTTGRCARRNPDALPVIDYQALYPDDPKHFPLNRNLPILNMLCTAPAVAKGACQANEIVHSDLTAIITGPGAGNFPSTIPPADQPPALRAISLLPDRLDPYREFTIIYHESFLVEQAFPDLYANASLPSLGSAPDNFGINYGMGGIGSEILANRIGVGPMKDCLECKYEEFFLSSWTVGDPAMNVDVPATDCVNPSTNQPIPGCKATRAKYPDDPSNVYPSYLGDHVRFRVLHGGSDLHHIHHQHAHQWLHTPNSPNADYTDSQSFGPGSAFTMEMAYYGSGNVNQTVGDSIFHCHFYAHFASGMWGMWRVFDTLQTGTPLDPATGKPAAGVRAYPDGEIAAGTPIPAVVPVPTMPMPLLPAPVRLTDGKNFEVQLVDAQGRKGAWVSPLQGGVPPTAYRNPGYPFFVPGIGGHRPPHPPLDFAYACSDNGQRCAPGTAGEPRDTSLCAAPTTARCEALDGGLPRHLITAGTDSMPALNNTDFSKILTRTNAFKIAEEGTFVEQIAMKSHSQRLNPTCLPDGRCAGVCSDNGAPCSADPGGRWQCANPATATCVNQPITFVLNGLGPKPGAPFADPCIRFDRNGGPAPSALTRRYQAADIQLDAAFNKEGWHFPQERMISLWGDVQSFLNRSKAPEPFFFRANSNDCIEYTLANLVPNVYELDDFQVRTPTDILGQHIHLVKFDVTSSDGAANGWNYEDGTFAPNEVTERIHAINTAGGLDLRFTGGGRQNLVPKSIKLLGDGPGGTWLGAQATIQRWFADPLYDNAGACSNNPDLACTLVDVSQCGNPTATCDVTAGFCANNQARTCTAISSVARCGKPGECIARHDRTIRTVFTHDHFGPSTHQQAGLYAGLVVEPEGSVWRENESGRIFGGFDSATGRNIVLRSDGGPTSWQSVVETPRKEQSFREFLIELQDTTLTYQPFALRDFILDTRDLNWRGQFAGGVTAPCHAGEPCGFCGNDGVCVNTQTGQPVSPAQACDVLTTGISSPRACTTGTCRLRTGFLKPCTPEPAGFAACSGTGYGAANTQLDAVIKSCNLVAGFPASAWGTTPIDPPNTGSPEIITFFGATNNFSFNYRDEPLYPRTTDPYSGAVLAGRTGDLSYVYSSNVSIGRPNLLGSVCSANLALACGAANPCPSGAGTCQAASFCSDNFALCTAGTTGNPGNRSLCRNPSTAQCNRSFPYPALTADVAAGDPFTPLLRAYAGDDLQIRTLTGAHLNPHNLTLQGMNWLMQPSFVDSGWRNSQVMGISEHFDLMTRVPPAYSRGTTDFLYQPGAAALEQAGGNWGLLRAYDGKRSDLHPLPQNSAPAPAGYPVCPQGAPQRLFSVMALTAQQVLGSGGLVYNDGLNNGVGLSDTNALLFFNAAGPVLRCSNPANPASCGQLPITCNSGTCSNDRSKSCAYVSQCIEPMVLRAAAGDCIQVTLYNNIPAGTIPGNSSPQVTVPFGCALEVKDNNGNPTNCNLTGKPPCCTTAKSNTSTEVGFRPQLVAFDARTSGGFNVGQNAVANPGTALQTAGPGQKVSYTWYAGNVDAKARNAAERYIPVEFGAANLLTPDVMNHYFHGLMAGLVVEPQGSTGWEQGGVEAYVKEKDGSGFREFTVFTQDNLNSGGGFDAVNYGSEFLAANLPSTVTRSCAGCSSTDFSCSFTNSPFLSSNGACTPLNFIPQTPVFTACAGESVRFRLLHPGGINTNQVFEIYGHNWSESPYETEYDHCEAPTTQTNLWASQHQGTTNLCANQPFSLAKLAAVQRSEGDWQASLNAWFGARMGHGPTSHLDVLLAQAGGPFQKTGTYMYRSFPAMHFQFGVWGWFNVVDPGQNAKCSVVARPDTSLMNQLPTSGGTQ
jgi:hypothetical protein